MRRTTYVFALLLLTGCIWAIFNVGGGALLADSDRSHVPVAPQHDDADIDRIIFLDEWWDDNLARQIEEDPYYIARDFDAGIAPPPTNSAPETARDLEALLAMQENMRTAENLELIRQEHFVRTSPQSWLAGLGLIPVRPSGYEKLYGLLSIVNHDVSYVILRDKWHYKRARPTQLSESLTAVVPVPPHAAYPSGHGGQSYAMALILAYLDPEREDIYLSTAKEIGRRREIAGVHYESDTRAGQQIAQSVVGALLENDSFQRMIPGARQEFLSWVKEQHPE